MKTTTGGPRAAIHLTALLAAGFLAGVTPVAGQSSEDCHCVDRDGNAIENCTCFREPRFDDILSSALGSDQPRLGISVDVMQSARSDADGAVISDVLDGGPADEAGIREGDVITSIDGHSLAQSLGAREERDFDLDWSMPVQRLLAVVDGLEPGQEVEVTYLRDGETQTTTVETEDLSERWGRSSSIAIPRWNQDQFRDQMRSLTDGLRSFRYRSDDSDDQGDTGVLFRGRAPRADVRILGGDGSGSWVFGGDGLYGNDGLDLVELNPGLGSYFGAEEGVLVTEVGHNSGLGLEAGDVVLRVGDRAVTTPERFRRIMSSYGDEEEITFHILRKGAEQTVTGQKRY